MKHKCAVFVVTGMNLMRKLIGSGGVSAGGRSSAAAAAMLYDGSASVPPGGSGQTDYTLGLMHLRKLFTELKCPPSGTSQKELENMLYNMLPLFCKVSAVS